MKQRLNAFEKQPGVIKALYGLGAYLAKSKVEQSLLDLISFRISQINGCAYCLDMHSKDLRAMGETEQRLYKLNAWREAPVYTDRERAAFAWAEAVNNLNDGHVPDEVFNEVIQQFSEEEIVDLTMEVISINAWNRINIALRTPAGGYKVGQFAVPA